MTKRSKKHIASYKQRHHAKSMTKPQTTGSGSSSAPGASVDKDDTTPKSR